MTRKDTSAGEGVRVDAQTFTVEQQKLFTRGWEAAGGFMGDATKESPLFAPWSRDECITVTGEDPEAWGRAYWNERKEELATAALLEAFDSPRGSVAECLAGSMVMKARPAQVIFGTEHRTVTPAFEAEVLLEPLKVFAHGVFSAAPGEAGALADFAAAAGIHPERAMLYVFTDGSCLLREDDSYWVLTAEEGAALQKAFGAQA